MQSTLRARSAQLRVLWQIIIAPWPAALSWFIALVVVGGLAPFVQIWATTHLIDGLAAQLVGRAPSDLALGQALEPHIPWIAALVGAWIVGFIVSMNIVQPYIATYHAERIVALWSQRVLEKAVHLQLEQFERPTYFDSLQRAQAALNVEAIAAQHSQFQRILARVGGCVGIVWALAYVHWLLAAVLVASSVAVTRWQLQRRHAIVKIQYAQTPLQRRQDYWRDLVTQRSAAAEIRLFGLADYCIQQWRTIAQQLQDEINLVRFRNLYREIPVSIAYTTVFSLSGVALLVAAQERAFSPGVFVAMLIAIQQFLDLIQNFSRVDKIHAIVTQLGYVPAFLALEGQEQRSGASVPQFKNDGIRFCNLSFTYPGSQHPTLKNIDVHIRPGERIALVGENGAGKSTFVRLLLGLYRPSAGQILVEGVDLQMIDPAAWRSQAAAVFQDYMRYTGTAQDNIGYGQLGLLDDDTAIRDAAHKSGASAVVAQLPHGYATLLGKEFAGGVDLSGGQWQKFAIARAYLRDATLLVLDEPTAALDALAEQEVYRQFLSMSVGKTVLLISHRLGSARLADRIIFLQAGQIAQVGTHDALVQTGGPYAELYALQAAWYRDQEAAL